MSESMMERALKESCKIELQAVIDERQKWIKAIEDIKAEISEKQNVAYAKTNSEDATQKFTSWGRYWAHDEDLETIDKHTEKLQKAETNGE